MASAKVLQLKHAPSDSRYRHITGAPSGNYYASRPGDVFEVHEQADYDWLLRIRKRGCCGWRVDGPGQAIYQTP